MGDLDLLIVVKRSLLMHKFVIMSYENLFLGYLHLLQASLMFRFVTMSINLCENLSEGKALKMKSVPLKE